MRSSVSAVCLAAACAALPLRAQPSSQQSNVLILVADDVGVDNVGIYREGTTPPPTPNIDALAARGVLFRNAWADSMCSPTRACIMTGRYSFRTGVGFAIRAPNNPVTGTLRDEEVTLPEALDLGGSGYAHAAIGKWHLGRTATSPNEAGWSHFAGLIDGMASYTSWPRTVNGVTATCTEYATTKIVDDALGWINAQTGPWVCYVCFTAAHSPYHEPPASLHTRNLAAAGSLIISARSYFEAMVEAMDTEIGRLFTALGPRLGQTNVIFLGDNGSAPKTVLPPFTPCHAKTHPYEGGVRVPLIIAGPAVNQGGREETALVSAVDLFATVTELAGARARSVVPSWIDLDSVSMLPYLENAGQPPLRRTAFAELFYGGSNYINAATTNHAEIRNARYKLIRFFSGPYQHLGSGPRACQPTGVFPFDEFYDLDRDPFELNNLLAGTLSPTEKQNHDALVVAFDDLRTPGGTFRSFGVPGCAGSNGHPAISGVGTPTIGSSYQVNLHSGARSRAAELLFGGSYTRYNGVPLPIDLSLVGAGPSCLLYTSIQFAVPTTTDADGDATVSVSIPNDLTLVGQSIYHTWLVVDPSAPSNSLGLTSSNGAAAVIGL